VAEAAVVVERELAGERLLAVGRFVHMDVVPEVLGHHR